MKNHVNLSSYHDIEVSFEPVVPICHETQPDQDEICVHIHVPTHLWISGEDKEKVMDLFKKQNSICFFYLKS